MKKAMSLLLCACLLLGLSTMATARFTNIWSASCAAPLKGNVIKAGAELHLYSLVSGAKIVITARESGTLNETTYTKNVTATTTLYEQDIPVKANTAYTITFTFTAGVDKVSESFTVLT